MSDDAIRAASDAVTRVVRAFDTGDWPTFLSGFTPQATLRMADTFVGIDELEAFTRRVVEHDPGWPRSQHLVTNVLVDVAAPAAWAREASYSAYAARVHRLPSHQRSNSTVLWSGEVRARLVEAPTGGRWYIRELHLAPWEPVEAPL